MIFLYMLLQFRLSVYFLFRHGGGCLGLRRGGCGELRHGGGCLGLRRGGCGELRGRGKTNNTSDELASKQSDV